VGPQSSNSQNIQFGARCTLVAAFSDVRKQLPAPAGSLTMIGDEPYQPYDRPPLSKQVLDGWVAPAHTGLHTQPAAQSGGDAGFYVASPVSMPPSWSAQRVGRLAQTPGRDT
jgi:hypothetical protein